VLSVFEIAKIRNIIAENNPFIRVRCKELHESDESFLINFLDSVDAKKIQKIFKEGNYKGEDCLEILSQTN